MLELAEERQEVRRILVDALGGENVFPIGASLTEIADAAAQTIRFYQTP